MREETEDDMIMRLDKLLSDSGKATRSGAKEMIRSGRVFINGVVCKKPETKVDPERCEIRMDNEILGYRQNVYLMMNKPAGVISATEDERCETVLSLLPEELQKRDLFPVGRLDKDTEGLLLITDDGNFAHLLMSPKHHVDKVYFIKASDALTDEDRDAFSKGIVLGDGLICRPAKLEIISGSSDTEAFVTLQEGKYHQVKRMIASRGKKVQKLKRCSIGPVKLDPGLSPGEWRYLLPEEEEILKSLRK